MGKNKYRNYISVEEKTHTLSDDIVLNDKSEEKETFLNPKELTINSLNDLPAMDSMPTQVIKQLLKDQEKELLKNLNYISDYGILWILKKKDGEGFEKVIVRVRSVKDKKAQYNIELPSFKAGEKFAWLELGKMYLSSELCI